LKYAAATAAAVAATAATAYFAAKKARFWFSKALHSDRAEESTLARQIFRDTPIPEKKPPKNHTHPLAASDRTCVSQFAEYYALRMGVGAYFVQQSLADLRHDREGDRVMYWTKDALVPPREFTPKKRDVCVLVDVDYYVDMPVWLNQIPSNVILYTIVPESVASEGEVSFTFNRESEMVYTVNGGADYKHRLWNYFTDNFATVTWGWTGPQVRVWLVDSLRTSEHRAAILLTQTADWSFLRGWLAWGLLKCNLVTTRSLERLTVAKEQFLRLDVVRPEGIYRSTGRVDQFHCATIPVSSDDSIAAVARNSGVALTPAQVQPYVSRSADVDCTERGAIMALVDYHRDAAPKPFSVPQKIGVGGAALHRYQYGWASYDPESKTALCAFMNPILPEAYSPDMCLGNEKAAVQTRILDVQSDVKATPLLQQYMAEFVELAIPVPYQGDPVSIEVVFEKQNRPSQRVILEEASWMTRGKDLISSFLKREAYPEPKDPRVISTINGELKMKYSAFTYALTEHFCGYTDCGEPGVYAGRRTPWYAFGFTPKQIASFVAGLAERAKSWTDSDLSRMDGRKSEVLRDLEVAALLRFFRPHYHAEVHNLHRRTFKVPGVTTNGHKYKSEYDQRSGSPDTACFNTFDTAFIAYCAFRDSGYGPKESFQMIGIYGGDDGGTPDVQPDKLASAAAAVGQKLTLNVFTRGQKGISFLARYYGPGVWYGDANSMCDVARQLSKFHTTVNLPPTITPLMKCLEKVDAFMLTDSNTPVVGEFCLAVRRLCTVKTTVSAEYHRLLTPWGAQYALSEQYPNEVGPWGMEYAIEALQPYHFDWEAYRSQLRDAKTINDLLALRPVSVALPVPEVKDPVVVDGEVVAPPKGKEEAATGQKDGRGPCANAMCPFGKKGECKFGAKCKPNRPKSADARAPKSKPGGVKKAERPKQAKKDAAKVAK